MLARLKKKAERLLCNYLDQAARSVGAHALASIVIDYGKLRDMRRRAESAEAHADAAERMLADLRDAFQAVISRAEAAEAKVKQLQEEQRPADHSACPLCKDCGENLRPVAGLRGLLFCPACGGRYRVDPSVCTEAMARDREK